RFAPAKRKILIVSNQHSDGFFLAPTFRSLRPCRQSLPGLGFFRMTELSDVNSCNQNRHQQERDGDLEMTRNHLCPPARTRVCAMPDAMAEAMLVCIFASSKPRTLARSTASSTAMAGLTMLFKGRRKAWKSAALRSRFTNSRVTAFAAALLRSREAAWASSQGRKF